MTYCSQCGTQFEGRFCPACGTLAAGAAQAVPPPVGPPPVADGLAPNVASMLCYSLGILTGILFLVLAPYNANKLIRFHALQSIFFSAAMLVLNIAMSIILPWWLLLVVSPIISLGALGLWIFMLVKTYQGEKIVLPVIGPLAEQQA